MGGRQTDPIPDAGNQIGDGAFRLVVVMAVALLVLTSIRVVAVGDDRDAPGGSTAPAASNGPVAEPSSAPVDLSAFLEPEPRPAPPLALVGPDGTLTLDALRGEPVLVFFGYTHCPDVCPATIGQVGLAIDAYGGGARAVLVSVDPERDTPAWLEEFVRYMPPGFTAVSGNEDDVRTTADAWGVRYARVDTGDPDAYTMSHTADVFLVDAAGMLCARFPFGTEAATMAAVIDAIDPPRPGATTTPRETATVAPPAIPPSPSPGAPSPAADDLAPALVSSSVWAGTDGPVIFTLDDGAGEPESTTVTAQLAGPDGATVGAPVEAVGVRPPGIATVSYVAQLDIPSPGPWSVVVTALEPDVAAHRGVLHVRALDQGGTAAIGSPAPTARTATPADVGGDLTWLTTDPLPDPRLHATSTSDALASGRPFVLVVDSYAFKVTPQCGQAVVLAKRMLDRWTTVPFIHHEPYRYEVITTEPVIEGSIDDPRLTDVANAWGVGSAPWGVKSMPWAFVIDGEGIVRAKYQGVMGSADVDVMLALLTGGT
jgi:protein SCO1/2